MKSLGPDTWECTNRANGKVTAIFKDTLQGDTLSRSVTVPQRGRNDTIETSASKRVSGGPGFLGTWQDTEVSVAATGLELEANGSDGVVMRFPENRTECAGKFDGKPYPVTGGGIGPKTTIAFRKTGVASFEATTFIDGKAFYIDSYSVSTDGRMMIARGTPVSKKEPIEAVYERQ